MVNRTKINLEEILKKELQNSKIIKFASITLFVAGGVFVLGFGMKILNYTVNHYKNLSATLKR